MKKRAIAAFVVVVFLLSGWLFSREATRVRAFPATSWTEDHAADCAIVVTGGPGRVREGFDLLIRKSVQKLIISGVHPQAELRDIFPLWPYHGDLRESDVILEKTSQTTWGNAQQSLALVEALRCRDVVLVTSRLHMYRALSTFRAQFPSSIPIYPRAVISGSYTPGRHEVAWEAVKSIFYSLWAY
ncbi:MAG: YdcF family protein [Bdellovibrionaceae bacterium]|nr:YdcF family protein [Pseudobdellovibrionaceae bacterium]